MQVPQSLPPIKEEDRRKFERIRKEKEKQVAALSLEQLPVAYHGFLDPRGSLGYNPM